VQGEVEKLMSNLYCHSYKKVMAMLTAILLSACATSPQEVIIRDATDGSVGGLPKVTIEGSANDVNTNDTAKIEEQTAVRDVSRESSAVAIQPVYSASVRPQSPLQKKLLVSAQEKLSKNDLQGAIVLAEKGLRIDHNDPQFYIVLADAYERLDDKKQSAYFAQQGLRYAQKSSQEYRALKRWLP